MSLFSNSEINLKKNKNNFEFMIKNYHLFSKYWDNITKSIGNIKKIDNTSGVKLTIKCSECKNIYSLKEYLRKEGGELSYNDAVLMFKNIGEQIQYLEKDKYSLYLMELNDVIVMEFNDRIYFMYINTDKFVEIVDDNMVEVNKVFSKKKYFLSPELLKLSKIPTEISINTSYYSMALMIMYCLKKYDMSKGKVDMIMEHLEHIDGTKLYYSLERCFEEQANNRYYLYI